MTKKWIVGLGNPGKKYERTRHNAGFICLERYAALRKLGAWREKHDSLCLKCGLPEVQLTLIMPQTFMNESGKSLQAWRAKDGLDPARMLVVYDDMDLPLGKIRYRASGSAGSHNGMASVIECLGGGDFSRLRLGIGKPENPEDWADYVLRRFGKDEQPLLETAMDKALRAMQSWAEGVPAERLMSAANA